MIADYEEAKIKMREKNQQRRVSAGRSAMDRMRATIARIKARRAAAAEKVEAEAAPVVVEEAPVASGPIIAAPESQGTEMVVPNET